MPVTAAIPSHRRNSNTSTPPRDVNGGGENSRTRGHDPYIPPGDGRNEEMPGRNDRGDEPTPYQQGKGEQSWEHRFQDIQ